MLYVSRAYGSLKGSLDESIFHNLPLFLQIGVGLAEQNGLHAKGKSSKSSMKVRYKYSFFTCSKISELI
jgi:hypothetical protein